MIKNILVVLILFVFVGCATYKPDSYGVDTGLGNGRVIVENPHYIKRMNALGVSSIVGATIAGGYAGYNSNMITYYKNGEKKNMAVADAAIGALVGFSTSYLANYIIGGNNRTRKCNNSNKWLKDAQVNDTYNLISSDANSLKIIDKSFESKFNPSNYEDIEDFTAAFGDNSNYLDGVILEALPKISRNEILLLINKYPNTKSIGKIKYTYISKSENLRDLIKANLRFDDIEYDYLSHIKQLINIAKKRELSFLIADYPNYKYIDMFKYSYVDKSVNIKELYSASKKYPDIKYPYDKTAVALISNIKELNYLKDLVSESTLIKCKTKVDNLLWKQALSKNTIGGFQEYKKFTPLGLYNSQSTEKITELKRVIGDELLSLFKQKKIYGLYEFYEKYKNADNNFSRKQAKVAYDISVKISENNAVRYNNAVDNLKGYTLVKIIFKSKDNFPIFIKEKIIKEQIEEMHTSTVDLLSLFTGSAHGHKIFTEISDIQSCGNRCVVNAQWYKAGVNNEGWLTFNAGFKTFVKNIKSFAYNNDLIVEFVRYLGSRAEDIAEAKALEDYQQERCEKCQIDYSKTEIPHDEEGFWGTSRKNGKIYMLNGEKYEWDYYDNTFTIPGFFHSEHYDTFNEMLNAFIRKCENINCN